MAKRKIATIENSGRVAKIYRDAEFNEYSVRFVIDGVEQKDADYFTSDKQDAIDTANAWATPEVKAPMSNEAAKAYFQNSIEVATRRIAELEAIEHTDGYIVIVGDNIRLPMDEVQCKWCHVENASIYWHIEDARRFAARIVNGNNEKGQVVKKVDQIAWEISEQRQLIENLNKWISEVK